MLQAYKYLSYGLGYDLSGWKCQIPVNSAGILSGTTDAIESTDMNNLALPWITRYAGFYRFKAVSTGATTSGSTYPRAEFRHLTDRAYSETSEMKVVFHIRWLPSTVRTIVCQSLDGGGAQFKLEVTGGTLGGSDGLLKIKYDQTLGSAETSVTLRSNISFDSTGKSETISVRIRRAANKLEVFHGANVDGTTADWSDSSFFRDSGSGTYYWKYGNYLQNNSTTPVWSIVEFESGTSVNPSIVAVAPVISNVAYNTSTDVLSLDIDATGDGATIYYMLHTAGSAAAASAIEAGTGAVSGTAGSFSVVTGSNTADPTFEGVADGTYGLSIVAKKSGVYSNVGYIEVTFTTATGLSMGNITTGSNAGTGTDLTMSVPTGTSGNKLYAVVACRTDATPTFSSGPAMTQVGRIVNPTTYAADLVVFSRTLDGTEGTSWTVGGMTWTGGSITSFVIDGGSSSMQQLLEGNLAWSTTKTAPSVTALAGEMILRFVASNNQNVSTNFGLGTAFPVISDTMDMQGTYQGPVSAGATATSDATLAAGDQAVVATIRIG